MPANNHVKQRRMKRHAFTIWDSFTPEEIDNMPDDLRDKLNSQLMRIDYTSKTEFRFDIGVVIATEKLLDSCETTKKLARERRKTFGENFGDFFHNSFGRHCQCDWGDVTQKCRQANNSAIKSGGTLFSTYNHRLYPSIGINTESDRSKTLIGLAEEFSEKH